MSVAARRTRKTDVAKTQAQRERVRKETGRLQGLEHDELAVQVGRVRTGCNVEGEAMEGFKETRT